MYRFIQQFSYIFWLLFIAVPSWAAQENGLLWEISKPGTETSYLFGTIHSDDPRVLKLAPPVKTAFENAHSFSAELKMDFNSMLQAQQMMMLTDGNNLQDLIGQKRYEKAVVIMADYGMPEMIVRQMQPWAVAMTISVPKPRTGQFLDLVLYQSAGGAGKQLYGLESAAEQVAVFGNLSLSDQKIFLDQAIRDYKDLPKISEKLLALYLDRDLNGLKDYADQLQKDASPEIANVIEKELINKRNIRMVDRMSPRLEEGNAFIAVGALHLPGDEGLLRLLQKRGYRVTVIY